MPASPAPKSLEFIRNDIIGVATSPFTGGQQIQDWGASYAELVVTMPPMAEADAQDWVGFFISCRGMANVFLITNPVFLALIPFRMVPGRYWRLNSNKQKWSVNDGIIYGFQFELREALRELLKTRKRLK